MPRTRFQPPDRLLGATAFTRDDGVGGGLGLVRLLKANRWLWRDLRTACDLDHRYGRRREPGHWELVAVAFVVSGQVDIQPWHTETTDELWQACGFEDKPSYRTTWRRLRELADVADAFLVSVGVLIRRARVQDPRVMAHVHFDNTEDETHAALVHDCVRGECPRERTGRGHASGRGRAGAGARPRRQDTKLFREERQQLNALDPETAEREAAEHAPDRVEVVPRGTRMVKRVKIGGCWYRTLDLEAGIRAYTGPRGSKRFWHGYYSGKAVDHFTGGVIPYVESASVQEHVIFDGHYDLVCELLGEPPESAIGDKGLSIATAFEKCTTNGTAPVFPWRPGGGDYTRHDKDTHDRHGIPRCQHCGGPTDFVRFSPGSRSRPPARRQPRIWFRCMVGATPECEPEQTIACSTDYRLLVPLYRTSALYHELKESHSSYEAAHDWWRDRYKVAADDIGIRPKVRDLGFHRLRANVASLIEWLRICYREGWLGNPRRNHRNATRAFRDRAQRIAARLADMRARMGLTAAYGEAAEELGLGQRTPPSRRPRGPNGQQALDIPDS
jgi:hypothetical protein